MRFLSRAACLRVLRCALLVIWFVGGVGAWAQQLVTDAPVARPGGTAFVGTYTADTVFSAGPTFHFTAPVAITSIAYDAGPAGVQELSVRSLNGCNVGSVTAAGVVCGIETAIVSRYPGMRYGRLRISTTNGVFTLPVAWESVGAQVAVTPGVLSTPNGSADVTGTSLALDALGNVYLSGGDNVIRKLDAITGAVTLIAGVAGNANRDGDGGPATAAHIGVAVDVAVSPAGDVYLVSSSPRADDTVRKVDGGTGLISTAANFPTGRATGEQGNDGAVAVDDQGNIYMSVTRDGALMVTAGNGGAPRYLIGGGQYGSQACNAGAGFAPTALTTREGYIYFASHAAVYKVSADPAACHAPLLIAGTGIAGNSGDGGLAAKAALGDISGLAVDAAGDIYIADATADVVRMVSSATGIIMTVAGAESALPSVTVGSGLASLALDVRGNLYVLSIRGAIQKIDVSFGTLRYAPTAIGHLSSDSPQGVVFTNIGNDELSSATVAPVFPSGGFAENPLTTTCGQGNASSLPRGASCRVGVDFVPIETGVSSGILTLGTTAVYLQGSSATATQTKPLYTAWVEPGSVKVQQGASNTAKFVFAPTGGFRGAVTFACTGLPAGAVCSFAPATLIADGSDAQQTSTLTVSMQGAATPASLGGSGSRSLALSTMASFAMLLMWLKLRRKGALSLQLLPVLLLLCVCVGGVTGCGAGGVLQASAQAVSTQVNVVSTNTADGSSQTTSFLLIAR